jgi:YHS domain-containing protein
LKSPDRFVPRLRGYDVVQFVDHDRVTLGSRDYGVFYLDGIWLFESEASRSKFEDNPKRYTTGSLNDAQAADSAAAQSPMPPAAASERSDCEAFPRVSRGGFFETSEAARNVPSNGYAAYGSSNGSAGSSADAYPKTSWNELVKLPAPEPNSAPPIQPAAGQPPLALEGYSAVTLVELRKWRLGDPRYSAIHRGRLYLFASEFEQQAFVKDPDRYRVGNDGFDIVEQVDHQRQTLGKCQYGAFWCQQILLFSSQESRAHFERNSGPYHRAMFSSVFSEGLLSDGRYENHRPAAEAERSTAAAPAKTTPRAAPTRVGRRRAFGRRIR